MNLARIPRQSWAPRVRRIRVIENAGVHRVAFEALELYARVVQRIEPDSDTPEAGAEGEVTHAG